MDINSQQAKDWISSQWQAIASAPYRSDAFRALVYQNLIMAISLEPEKRTPAQVKLISAFQEYIKQRRIYMAQMGLAMYDAWKAYDDKAKQSAKRSSFAGSFSTTAQSHWISMERWVLLRRLARAALDSPAQ